MCPGEPPFSILSILGEQLRIHTVRVQVEDYHCHTKSTFRWHNFPRSVKRQYRFTHQAGGLSVLPPHVRIFSLKTWGESPLAICIFRMVLPLLYFSPVHHLIPLISVFNALVLISKRVEFLGQIPWRRWRQGALTWLSFVICEVSGFSWYILYVFLLRIVREDKIIRTNCFRSHP